MNGMDGEPEEVDETTTYWFFDGKDILVKFSPARVDLWSLVTIRDPRTCKDLVMVIDMCVMASKKGWFKYYLRLPGPWLAAGVMEA